MKYSLLLVLCIALGGCNFDTSTRYPDVDKADQSGDGGVGTGCEQFAPSDCNECGRTACEELPDGSVSLTCQPDPTSDVCKANFSCESDGQCQADGVPTRECDPGTKRPCDECGIEVCLGGQWSGTCVADHDGCGAGSFCFPEQAQGPFICQEGCDTTGFQLSPDDYIIPDFVSVGEEWESIDNCPEEDEFRICACVLNVSSEPTVVCGPCDWF